MNASIAIKQDLPDIADEIVAAAQSDSGLAEALQDYEQACERMNDAQAKPGDRKLWAEIRTELSAEIRRVYLALIPDEQKRTINDN